MRWQTVHRDSPPHVVLAFLGSRVGTGVGLWRTEAVVSLAHGLCTDWEFEKRLRSAEPRVALPARYRISSASEHASRT